LRFTIDNVNVESRTMALKSWRMAIDYSCTRHNIKTEAIKSFGQKEGFGLEEREGEAS
jgi:hypothetical protein